MTEQRDPPVEEKLNVETGRIGWDELARHFARGVVIRVTDELDLVKVAAAVAEDDKARVADWLASGAIANASLDDARRWERSGELLWAVVVAPWVLVQEP